MDTLPGIVIDMGRAFQIAAQRVVEIQWPTRQQLYDLRHEILKNAAGTLSTQHSESRGGACGGGQLRASDRAVSDEVQWTLVVAK